MLNYIESFLEMLSATRFVAKNTLEAYKHDLCWFAEQINKNLFELNEEDLNNIFITPQILKLSSATRARRIITIRQFFQYLHNANYCTKNPTDCLDLPKKEQNLPKTLTEAEIDKLLQLARQEANFNYKSAKDIQRAVRLYSILTTLYASGLRISELCALKVIALQKTETNFILIKGKGGKERLVPINQESKDALNKWLKLRNIKYLKSKNPYLYPANSASQYVARQVIAREIKAIAIRANLSHWEVSPHVFRHAIASHMLQHGSDLRVLQKILGHSDIATTQIYTHILDTKLYKTVEKYHPLAQKLNR